MMKRSIAYEKSLLFGVEIAILCQRLKQKREFNFSDQLIRSANSIAANIAEAIGAHSKKEFLCKIDIALKEAHESEHWLKVLQNSQIVPGDYGHYLSLVHEVIKILCKTSITTKINLNKTKPS
ncbi:MAG: four helix bundle protein [Candidatus Abawacabacteria bacterium]|nr:four helix bundle protein [Candidatus Abawacabacteria bacterium]